MNVPILAEEYLSRLAELKKEMDECQTEIRLVYAKLTKYLAEGHLASIDYLNTSESCLEFINLGSGKGYSVFQIIRQFELSTGCRIPFSIESRRDGDVAVSYADISKAKRLLSWTPKRSLEQICLDGWNWQMKNPNGYG